MAAHTKSVLIYKILLTFRFHPLSQNNAYRYMIYKLGLHSVSTFGDHHITCLNTCPPIPHSFIQGVSYSM